MKLFGILFGKYKLIPINDFNALYGVINAAHSRLQAIEVSTERTYHAGEKEEVLNLLQEAKQIIRL